MTRLLQVGFCVALAGACSSSRSQSSERVEAPTDSEVAVEPDGTRESHPAMSESAGAAPDAPDAISTGSAGDGAARPHDADTSGPDSSVPDPMVVDGSVPPGGLAEQLLGDWYTTVGIGNCFDQEDWYSFEPGGSVTYRAIDDNSCVGATLQTKVNGSYLLDGDRRLLQVMREGEYQLLARSYPLASRPAVPVGTLASFREHMTIAFGARPTPGVRAGEVLLDGRAFISHDGRNFQSERYLQIALDGADPFYEEEALLSLALDRPLPLEAGTTTAVTLTLTLSLLDTAVAPDALRDTLSIEFDATIATDGQWRELAFVGFDGLGSGDRRSAFDALLAEQGIGEHPAAAAAALRAHFFPLLRFVETEPNVLSSSLPHHGELARSDTPPPVL